MFIVTEYAALTKGLTVVYNIVFEKECSGSVVELLTLGRGVAGSSLTKGTMLSTWARHFILCFVLVQPRKTGKHPDMTAKLLSINTNK